MFLVSQSYPAGPNLPTSFTVSGLPSGDQTIQETPAADGSVALHLDLSSVAVGNYNVTATASNDAGPSQASTGFALVIAPPAVIPDAPVLTTSPT